MLEKVKQLGLEKFAGDEKLANEFVDGFMEELEKMAMVEKLAAIHIPNFDKNEIRMHSAGDYKALNDMLAPDKKEPTDAERAVSSFGEALGKGFGGLAVSLGVSGIGHMYGNLRNGYLHTKFLEALAKAVSMNPYLKDAKDKERIKQYADTIFKFAPNVATDPNVLSTILAHSVHGEGMDANIIKNLSDLEARYRENKGFSPKAYV